MKNKSLLFIHSAFILSAFISACSSGSKPSSQNLHTVCQGFSLTCQHGGTCGEGYLGNNQYNDTCTCPSAYEGTYCETPTRNKYIGTYIGVMSQQYTGATKADTYPDTVIIIANADETKANVQHLYQFMTASPYAPAAYDTIICQASYGYLEGVSGTHFQLSFSDAANKQLHFECNSGALSFGGLSASWFDGTRQ